MFLSVHYYSWAAEACIGLHQLGGGGGLGRGGVEGAEGGDRKHEGNMWLYLVILCMNE